MVCFFEFLTPFTLGGHNFLISNLFSMIVSVSNVPRGGFKFCLDTRNNGALPLDPACPECLSVWSPVGLPYKTMSSMKPFVKYMDARSGKTKDPWSNPSEDGCTPSSPFILLSLGFKAPTFSLPFCLNCSLLDLNLVHMLLLHLTWMLFKVFLCSVIHMYLKGICILGKHRYFVPNLLPAQHV